jgi:hypothetical protein
MNPGVTTENLDGITVVTLNRPEVRNAVDAQTARALHAAFLAFDDDPASRVAVFHGAHGHFCAGWDLQAGARLHAAGVQGNALTHLDWAPGAQRPLGPMGPSRLLLSKPVIAAVSGAAVAGGMELALWCDLRVMEVDAYFGVYCRRFGVPLIGRGAGRRDHAGASAGRLSAGHDERRPPECASARGPAAGRGVAPGMGCGAGLPGRCAGRRRPIFGRRGAAREILSRIGLSPSSNGHLLLSIGEFPGPHPVVPSGAPAARDQTSGRSIGRGRPWSSMAT